MNSTHFDIYEVNISPARPLTVPFIDEGIPAGFPSPATDYVGDRIDLNEELILNPGSTYYARVRDYHLIEEELEQGDAILFDTSLAPRTGDLAMCEIYGERVLKYIRKESRSIYLVDGGSSEEVTVDMDTEVKVIGIVTVIIKVRRFKKRRTKVIKRLPQKEQPMIFQRRAILAFFEPNRSVKNSGLIDLNEELIVNPIFTFFGKVSGFSLLDDDINDRDSVIIDKSLEPEFGDLTVCVTPDGFTMKYVEVKENGEFWLVPGNKEYQPIRVAEDNERLIWGIVTHSIRQLRSKNDKNPKKGYKRK